MTGDWIDVSRWQGAINWDQVKASGVQGAIIKAGGADGGLYTDSQFARNRDEARRVGLLRRTYWFEDPGVPAAEQAGYYLNLTAGVPPSIDLERGGPTTHDSALAVCTAALAPGDWVYGSAYFLRDNLNGDAAFAKWALWIAGYPTYPFIPPPWHSVVAHQNTNARSVAGISGGVDSSIVYAAAAQGDDVTESERNNWVFVGKVLAGKYPVDPADFAAYAPLFHDNGDNVQDIVFKIWLEQGGPEWMDKLKAGGAAGPAGPVGPTGPKGDPGPAVASGTKFTGTVD